MALAAAAAAASTTLPPPARFSDVVCNGARHPPRIALLLSGGFRALTLPLVYHSLKQNLIDSLGTPATVFMYLKVNATEPSLSIEAVNRMLLVVTGVPREHLVLLNESVSDLANCSNYHVWPSEHRDHHSRQAALRNIVAQLSNRAASIQLIEDYERRWSQRFDWILYARPDLLWYQPIRPWCFFADMRSPLTRIINRHDFAFLLPRALMHNLLRAPFERYRQCEKDIPPGKIIEHFERYRWRESGLERTVMGNDMGEVHNGTVHHLLPCALVRLTPSALKVTMQGKLDCGSWSDINYEQRAWMPTVPALLERLCKHLLPFQDEPSEPQ